MSTSAKAQKEGRAAARSGQPITSCPYKSDQAVLRIAWFQGYDEGRAEQRQ